MSQSPKFLHSKSQTSSSQLNHGCELRGPQFQQIAESQIKVGRDMPFSKSARSPFSLKTVAVNRRHSADESISEGAELAPEQNLTERFHPYRRQFSDGALPATSCLQQFTSSFTSLQEICSPDNNEIPRTWDHYNGNIQSSFPELPAVPVQPSGFVSHNFSSYNSLSTPQQVPSKTFHNDEQPINSKYSPQSFSTRSHQESATQSTFPKPIYSYSILIYMALMNSKTGSLPVNEIYSFMTEHFPYFKTAPDGWKNSVRHNLSLNKCFEKVENRNGNTSRKGCLWALNPTKVERMQEELRKWRRKDPLTVRRSMARPEDLDRLFGEKLEKFRTLPPYSSSTSLSKGTPIYGTSSMCPPNRHSPYSHVDLQQPYNFPPTTASLYLYSPYEQQPPTDVTSIPQSLNSCMDGKAPPVYDNVPQADYTINMRTTGDLISEGNAIYDIDTINPSLTDLQLQGNLWDELKEDSLLSEHCISTSTCSTKFISTDHHVQNNCVQVSRSHTLGPSGGLCKTGYEENIDGNSWNRDCPASYSGVESLGGYLTCYNTSVSLV